MKPGPSYFKYLCSGFNIITHFKKSIQINGIAENKKYVRVIKEVKLRDTFFPRQMSFHVHNSVKTLFR